MTASAERRRELERSARGLASGSLEERREAALSLLEAARHGELVSEIEVALTLAADDQDPLVRRRARLSLVVGALARNSQMVDEQVVVLDALSRDEASGEQRAAELLESLWSDWQHLGALAERLVPLYVQAIQQSDNRVVRAGLGALRGVAAYADSLQEAIAPLGRLLVAAPADVPLDWIAWTLVRLAERGRDIGECADVLVGVMDGDDESLAHIAAQALGRHLAVIGDGALVARLLAHPSVAVRQGIARALDVAALNDVDVQFAMSALNTAALDEAGGVSYHALRAICAAVLRGADVAPVREALEKWSQRSWYSKEGWYPYLCPDDADDLGHEHPGREARIALQIGEQRQSH